MGQETPLVDIENPSNMVSGQKVCNPIGAFQSHEGHSFFISNQLLEIAGTNIKIVTERFVDRYLSIVKDLYNGKINLTETKKKQAEKVKKKSYTPLYLRLFGAK
jgi:NAD-dependent DNA ligase